jgi:hypothetical protein
MSTLNWLALSPGVRFATRLGPQFADGLIDSAPTGRIARDDKSFSSIDAESKMGRPAWIAAGMNEDLFAPGQSDSITKTGVPRIWLNFGHG